MESISYPMHVFHVRENFRLKELKKLFEKFLQAADGQRLLCQLDKESYFLLYNFGAVVFFNVSPELRETYLREIKAASPHVSDVVTTDEFLVEVSLGSKAQFEFDKLILPKISIGVIDLLSLVLAQSTALEYYETMIDSLMKDLEDFSLGAARRSWFRMSQKKVLPFVQRVLKIKRALIGSVYLLGKPDITWEKKDLDDLYEKAVIMFELKDRFKSLDYQLKSMQEDMTLLSDLMVDRQMITLEVAIVGLFILDLLLLLGEILIR